MSADEDQFNDETFGGDAADDLNDETFGGLVDSDELGDEEWTPNTELMLLADADHRREIGQLPEAVEEIEVEDTQTQGGFLDESFYDSLVQDDDEEEVLAEGEVRSIQVQQQQQQQQQKTQQQQQQQPTIAAPARPVIGPLIDEPSRDERSDLFDQHHHLPLLHWDKSFKHMDADDIENMLNLQRLQLKNSTYAEDYYYQQLTSAIYSGSKRPPSKKPPLTGLHEPICCNPLMPPVYVPKNKDLFKNVLGKIPPTSTKAPKAEVQLDDSFEFGKLAPLDSKAIRQLLSGEPFTRHTILSVVEDGLTVSLHCTDLLETIPQLPPDSRPYYEQKLEINQSWLVYILNVILTRDIFGLLLGIGKARRMLCRCMDALPAAHVTALTRVLLQYGGTLIAVERDGGPLESRLRSTISSLSHAQLVSAFNVFLRNGCGSTVEGIQVIARTRSGSRMFQALLRNVSSRSQKNDEAAVVVPPSFTFDLQYFINALEPMFGDEELQKVIWPIVEVIASLANNEQKMALVKHFLGVLSEDGLSADGQALAEALGIKRM